MEDQSSSSSRLTAKQQRFLQAYVGPARFNASKAAEMAGYSSKSAARIGHDLKKTPSIRARIEEQLADEALSAREILHELRDVAMRGLDEMIDVRQFGDELSARMDASAKMKALELLGKHDQLFTDNVNHGGGVQIEIIGVDVDKL